MSLPPYWRQEGGGNLPSGSSQALGRGKGRVKESQQRGQEVSPPKGHQLESGSFVAVRMGNKTSQKSLVSQILERGQ